MFEKKTYYPYPLPRNDDQAFHYNMQRWYLNQSQIEQNKWEQPQQWNIEQYPQSNQWNNPAQLSKWNNSSNYNSPNMNEWNQQYPQQMEQGNIQTPFEYFKKESQPNDWYLNTMNNPPNYNPNPPKKKGSPLMAYFQDEDGQMDLDKMFQTVGKFAGTINQITPVVKQVGALIKRF